MYQRDSIKIKNQIINIKIVPQWNESSQIIAIIEELEFIKIVSMEQASIIYGTKNSWPKIEQRQIIMRILLKLD